MKTALIIGGTGGIGSAVSRLFTEQNIKTYATYYSNQKKAKAMDRLLNNFKILQCDIRKERDIKRTIDTILKAESKIDILVNSVTGSLKLKPFSNLSIDDFSDDIDTILLGTIKIYKCIIPIMKKCGSGTIVNLLTSAIFDFPARMSSYVIAKSGLFALMKTVSKEVERSNIRIVGISPYFVNTDLIRAFPEKLLEMEKEKILEAEDIAKLVLAMFRDEKKYPNGTNLKVPTRKIGLEEIAYKSEKE